MERLTPDYKKEERSKEVKKKTSVKWPRRNWGREGRKIPLSVFVSFLLFLSLDGLAAHNLAIESLSFLFFFFRQYACILASSEN